MGLLVDGIWHNTWYNTHTSGGHFIREDAQFRHYITHDGSAGPAGNAGFQAEKGRYHLFVSYACPWAHRTLIFRKIKGLENFINVSFVHWHMAEHGWTFAHDDDGIVGDALFNSQFAHQLYTKANANYSGRVTVPILWDTHTNSIVSNESSEIIRMFNNAFDNIGAKKGDYYPLHLQHDIDSFNERIYNHINNGVYKAGFATSQQAYDDAIIPLFDALNWLDSILADKRFLTGDTITEADWRLFPTLLRFDPVYVGHFKCSYKNITDYPNLWAYTRDLYQSPGIIDTINMEHIRKHYYLSHKTINPTSILPIMPYIDWMQPHHRA